MRKTEITYSKTPNPMNPSGFDVSKTKKTTKVSNFFGRTTTKVKTKTENNYNNPATYSTNKTKSKIVSRGGKVIKQKFY